MKFINWEQKGTLINLNGFKYSNVNKYHFQVMCMCLSLIADQILNDSLYCSNKYN